VVEFPSFDLTGKVAVVTGASRGIGRTLALGLAHAGADVVVSGRTVPELESLANEIRAMGRKALAQPGDVSRLSDIQELADATMGEFGRVDILVNNAGIMIDESSFDVTEEHWDRVMNTNLKGLFFCCQIIGRLMVSQKKGKIINMSSTFGLVGFRNRAAYAASKGGVTNLTRALAIEWGPYNVNVNAIAPTATRTSVNEQQFADPKWRAHVLSLIPVGRFGQPKDLVGAVVYLAGNASDMVTGVTLPVDGGWTAW